MVEFVQSNQLSEFQMKTLLQITSSLNADAGQSSRLAKRFVAAWRESNPNGEVIERDLAKQPVPHLDDARFAAFFSKPVERTIEQQRVVDYSDRLIDELKRAEVIVLGLPMYNFGVPSTLKAYFDHIARAGVTFRYTDKGPVGLLGGKEVFVFAARGGLYAGTPRDTQTPYVREFLSFLGMDDVEFIYAEGLALGDEHQKKALDRAHAAIDRLIAPQPLAA
jgi:FMN-dependent NADH-azoreductase